MGASGKYFGKEMKRSEDQQLLTGKALFVDDVDLPGTLHVAFYRSQSAHARIVSIDTTAAKEREGVVAVYTAEDMGEYWQPGPLLVPPPPVEGKIFHERTQVPLAKGKVRQAGEPIVAVIAKSRYIAEDAVNDIMVETEEIAAVVDLEKALLPETPLVHEDLESNLAAHVIQQKGDYDSIRDKADLLISRKFHYDRGAAAAMENRGIVASWDEKAKELVMWDTTQAPIPLRNGFAAMFGLSQHQVRVIAPFIGGAFGPKIMMFYPEEVVCVWATMQLGRPIKWIEDREENFFATTQERLQIHNAELATTKDGIILGVRDEFLHDTGAYDPYGLTLPINSQCNVLAAYKVPNYYSDFKVVFTNKPIVTPVRGAGRQHGMFVMERLLDIAAKELGISVVEIRRRNFLEKDDFPHNHEILFQDFAPLVYDSGDYAPALESVVKAMGFEKFMSEEKARYKAEGRHVGIGIVSYVEGTGIGPYEGARIRIEPTGKVSLATGVGTQGQGHFTVFPQIVADQIGVPAEDIHTVTGDTRDFDWGTGTFASRGAVVAGNACHAAALALRKKILLHAGRHFEVEEDQLEIGDSHVWVKGSPDKRISLADLAGLANPHRGAVQPGTEPGLEATAYFGPASGSTAFGSHGVILEVDPETMMLKILKYVVAHDCGRVINPMIVEGQIHGGVAHGIGNAYYEQVHFDENGQIQNASFMDYLLPTANDVPHIECMHSETPSPLNPLGIKGVGEAGAIPVGAVFAQAVEDALSDYGIEVTEMPLSPNKLFELMQKSRTTESTEDTEGV
ncbi:MAG: xanthine dehydrogenase family protein molybdopterin-binding subunit [Verrucomicrobia bacterium]|nr:xanthine dehydrogenase family protein molybdopterin-binding subunit [Verrucomicrobiota bacterium]